MKSVFPAYPTEPQRRAERPCLAAGAVRVEIPWRRIAKLRQHSPPISSGLAGASCSLCRFMLEQWRTSKRAIVIM